MTRWMRLASYHTVVGQHAGAWRVSTQAVDTESLDQHRQAAQAAEAAGFELLLTTDVLGEQGDPVSPHFLPRLEPAVLLAALAASTERIGLVGSFSTSFNDPYHLARQLSSLDHVSRGRAGWNIVTSFRTEAAAGFSSGELPGHAERYLRARDFVQAALALWDAWQPDAVVRQRGTGTYVDPTRVHPVSYASDELDVRGVLPASRSPQGRPLLVQAGSSDDGRALAASHADVVLTSQDHLPDAQRFYREIKSRAVDAGRDPDKLLVLPGVVTIVGDSRAQAQEVRERLDAALDDDAARCRLSALLGWDTSGLPFDSPVDLPPAATQGHRSRATQLHERAVREGLGIGALARVAEATRGHRLVVGTARDVAEELVGWYEQDAADGFLVGPAVMPSGLRRFARDVVPLLRAAGVLTGREREGASTLRERLGVA